MTHSLALAHLLLAASSKKSSSSSAFLTPLILVGLAVLGYFFFIKPQQRKAQAARAAQGSGIEVGDEVQTVGGVIGTVLEIHGDRYTLLTGALGDDGNLDGPQPTRIVFVRQAIAKKIEPVESAGGGDSDTVTDVRPNTSSNGSGGNTDGDIDDVGGDSTTTTGEHGGEAEEA
jgi:preprotein translocase YajC subunit